MLLRRIWAITLLAAAPGMMPAQTSVATSAPRPAQPWDRPPMVTQAQRFLARRGGGIARRTAHFPSSRVGVLAVAASSSAGNAWQPLGPAALNTERYGLVTGRVSALALDPSDPTGNRLFVGTTGGGVWVSQNAATTDISRIAFTPLTDNLGAMFGAPDASISIGALSVQPGGTGVILAGTGDPNDALDSYYGAGILRSTDGGNTWSLIPSAHLWNNRDAGLSNYSFLGEGFAGFAWSTADPQLVVAAVSQAYEGSLVGALRSPRSYEGLYYSNDSGATWYLAQIKDLNGQVVQGQNDLFDNPDGNAATSVVWNPIRRLFIAAVRYHGYYQSTDGAHWLRLAAQPSAGLTTTMCPARPGAPGSTDCPIYRGTLAVNPLNGDTFAWTVDILNQDQGIWQDACAPVGTSCSNPSIAFGRQWKTDKLQSVSWVGAKTIPDGSYNLALAAVPADQDTILLAGANDLWKCSLAMGCVWRNTTNASTCASARVGKYQHALEWNSTNPLELFVGNDSGLWRSQDGIAESGSVCSSDDAAHFQNLNGALGSLAEVESMSAVGATPYTMMLGLGANGTAGTKSSAGPTTVWPQILTGEGGPVAIDAAHPDKWYVNNGAGVSIHLCSQSELCTPQDFGSPPVVSNADVNGDGLIMSWPAPFLVDPLDPSQLLVGTCRVWRGPANGDAWTSGNAVSPMFDGNRTSPSCNGNALIRTLAAMPLASGGEVVYAGTYGSAQIGLGATVPGHIFSATMDASGTWSAWQDLALNPVSNDNNKLMNPFAMDVSSIFIDPHNPTGNTVYVTIEGIPNPVQNLGMVFRSTDGGAHWADIASNLIDSAANSLVVDPLDPNTVYIATDAGVFITRDVASCAGTTTCWSSFGAGLPNAPAVALSAAPPATLPSVLVAGTYGRGVWQIPLATAGLQLTTANVSPSTLDFGSQGFGTSSQPQTVTLTNTGGIGLIATISVSGDFTETNDCSGKTINSQSSCAVQVTFRPTEEGPRNGRLSISANIAAGTISVPLTGTGESPGVVSLTPTSLEFGQVKVGATSKPLSLTAENSGQSAVPIASVSISGPFVLVTNSCGTSSLPGNSDCQFQVAFAPTAAGPATGWLTMVDDAGTQTVQLNGTGAAPPTDTLSSTSLSFADTAIGQASMAQNLTITNSGDLPLGSIAASVTGPFQVTNSCTTVLPAHSSCPLAVVFAPTQPGPQSGRLTIADDLNPSRTVALSGTALKPPAFTVIPPSLTFAAQQAGSASAPATLKITNSGGAPAANVGFQISGPSAGSFSTGATSCGSSLDAGASCTMQVIFTPASTGGLAATLTVSSSTNGVSPVTVSLSGTGQSPSGLTVNPTQLSFQPQDLNQSSAAQVVTITNPAGLAMNGLSLTVSGPFSLTQNTCGASLAAGASCSTGIVFTPPSRGPLSGSLTVTAAGLPTPATVALSGIGGLTGAVRITPSLVNFPVTGVGATSSPVTLTISNSNAAVQLDGVRLAVSSGFKIAHTSCTASLQAGASCTVDVAFAPTAVNAQTGTLTLTSDELAASVTEPLSGMGFDFHAENSGAASQTISSGQTANYMLAISNSSESSGTFTLACGALPSYAACVFGSSTTTITGNGSGSLSVQITTSQASAAQVPAAPGPWRGWAPVLALAFLPLALRRRRALLLTVVGLIATVAMSLSACSSSGGGGGSSPPPPVAHTTPAGTYSIPVTVSAIGVQHTVTLTLVVD